MTPADSERRRHTAQALSWLAGGVGFYPPGMNSAEALTAYFAAVLPDGLIVDEPRPRDNGVGWVFRVTGLVDHEGQAVTALEMVPLEELAGLFIAEIFSDMGALSGPVGEA